MANQHCRAVARDETGGGLAWHPPMMRVLSLPLLVRAALLAVACLCAPTGKGFAGWRDDMKTFRIGLIAQDGASHAVPGLSVLKQAYARALGIPVEILVARDYASLIDAQAAARVDYAIYSTTAYATTLLLCDCVEPVAAPVGENGATGIRAILVTRDGRLAKLEDIATHRVAMAPFDSIAGYALPRSEFAAAKLVLTGDEPFVVRAEKASEAEEMLADGTVDAIFGWTAANADVDSEFSGGTLERLQAAGIAGSSLTVVWKSELLRYGPHALRSGLDPELREIVVELLTGLKQSQADVYDLLEAHRGGGFVEVRAADYAAAVDMVRSIAAAAPR
jgi:phosphonate transport system substrate-binding protein